MGTGPILAIETSVPTARVAVLAASGEVVSRAERTAARHSSNLLQMCDEVMRAAGVAVGTLAGIACGAGPGSFTGLRVGFSVAKGLALPADIPLVLVSSLEVLAWDLATSESALAEAGLARRSESAGGHGNPARVPILMLAEAGLARRSETIIPCIDAGKDQVYSQIWRPGAGQLVSAVDGAAYDPAELCEVLTELPDANRVIIGGTGVERYAELFAARLGDGALRRQAPGPSAESLGKLALAKLARGERDDLASAVPTYGRAPDITHPRRRGPRQSL